MSNQIIDMYMVGHGAPAIAKALGTNNHKVYRVLRNAGISIRSHRQKSLKYNVNENFFETIDSESKAYWLGFLAADGYQSQGALGCSLGIKDLDHLEKLRSALEADHPVKVYTQTKGYAPGSQYARLLIKNPKLCKDLSSHGVKERKTHTLAFPDMPDELKHHFIRGYFDGDGCWARSKKSASGFTLKLCGTKNLLEAIADFLQLPRKFVRPHKSIYSLEKSGRDVLRLMNLLYTDATIFLERKHERWFEAQSLLGVNPVE